MTVFKTFLRIINKNKIILIIQTIILLLFAGFNMQANENGMNFVASKPDIAIINYDGDEKLTKNLIRYIKDNSNIIELDQEKTQINDALFYRKVNYVIYIPKGYHIDFINGKSPEIKVKSTGDYQASFAEMIISGYIKVANIYRKSITDEDDLISKINDTLTKKTKVEITSKLDTTTLERASFYFNFESYSLLNCLIYVICLLLSIFNSERIRKRTIISSIDYRKHNRILLISNYLYAFIMWLFYFILGCILIGEIMFTMHGLILMINSFIFTICATTIAFLIGNIGVKKDAISGMTNVIALGSSFLCGAFVSQAWLPDFVLKIAHLLPTYYYIQTNDRLKMLENFDFNSLQPILVNMMMMIVFIFFFIILTDFLMRRKQKID